MMNEILQWILIIAAIIVAMNNSDNLQNLAQSVASLRWSDEPQ